MTEVKLTCSNGFGFGVLLGLSSCALITTGVLLASHCDLSNCCTKIFSKSCSTTRTIQKSTPKSSSNSEQKGDEMEVAQDREAFWFIEGMTEHFYSHLALKSILFEGRSDFQRVQIIETEEFGKTLVMDGQTQSAEKDEKIYHESLVHPAMLMHENPKSVFIGGGGEFATAREVLRHKSVEKCVMVDIDELACKMCLQQLPEWSDGAHKDKKFKVFYDDAKKYLEESPDSEKFDVIIMDICDPIEAGPGYKLYTKEFYDFLQTKLTKNGVLVTQSGPGSFYNVQKDCFTVIHNTLKSSFKSVIPMTVDVPSFGSCWGFNIATMTLTLAEELLNKSNMEIDADLKNRLMPKKDLFFLDAMSFKGLLGVAKSIRKECEAESRVMTIDNPVFMYSS